MEKEILNYAKMCSVDMEGYSAIEQAVRYGIELHQSLPLHNRLTTAEKERIRKMYAECELIVMDDNPNLPADRITEAGAKMQVLEEIFGKEMFEKEVE